MGIFLLNLPTGLFARKDALLKIQMSQNEQGKTTTSLVTHVDACTMPDNMERSVQNADQR